MTPRKQIGRVGSEMADATKDAAKDANGTWAASGWQSVFVRGLSLGVLVGAAIAGSAVWDRRRSRRGRHPVSAKGAMRLGDHSATD